MACRGHWPSECGLELDSGPASHHLWACSSWDLAAVHLTCSGKQPWTLDSEDVLEDLAPVLEFASREGVGDEVVGNGEENPQKEKGGWHGQGIREDVQ